MGKIIQEEIKTVSDISGWMSIKTMARKESVTPQDIYYRAAHGRYLVLSLDGFILVKFKDPKRLRRRETQAENKV